MQQITITVDLTARNLEILKQLCDEDKVIAHIVPAENLSKGSCEVSKGSPEEHPVENPFPVAPAPAEEPEEKKISKTDVKAVCLKLSKEGKQDFLKQTFAKFGAKKLTEVAENDYPALMEELSNG